MSRLGGLGARVAVQLEDLIGQEARSVRLGHLQRGGEPTSFYRVLATRFDGKAVELILNGEFGRLVTNRLPDIVAVPLADVVGRTKQVQTELALVRTARALGISFGDEKPTRNEPT